MEKSLYSHNKSSFAGRHISVTLGYYTACIERSYFTVAEGRHQSALEGVRYMPTRASQDISIAAIVTAHEHQAPAQARAHLLALVQRLPDEAVIRLWRFVCWWVSHRS